jgi:hypothetical protein
MSGFEHRTNHSAICCSILLRPECTLLDKIQHALNGRELFSLRDTQYYLMKQKLMKVHTENKTACTICVTVASSIVLEQYLVNT